MQQHLKRFVLRIYGKLLFLLEKKSFDRLPFEYKDLPYDTAVLLRIPTYDGSGQAVHPDIVRVRDPELLFVMAMTPYPFDDDYFENPSIVVSRDGLRFYEEKKGINPIVPPPDFDHNNDPDLLFSEGTWNMVYLETLRPGKQNLVLLQSNDRIQWKRKNLLMFELQGTSKDTLIASPALVEKEGSYYLFYVNLSTTPYRIECIISRSIDRWDKKKIAVPEFDALNVTPWHIDVFKDEGLYYMLLADITITRQGKRVHALHLADSKDLYQWNVHPEPIEIGKLKNLKSLYRSTGFREGNDMYIFFSAEFKGLIWRIGVIRKQMNSLIG